MDKVAAASNWSKRRRVTGKNPSGRGLGFSCVTHDSGNFSASAIVRLLEDGSITLNTGAVDLGQGCDTAMAQILRRGAPNRFVTCQCSGMRY